MGGKLRSVKARWKSAQDTATNQTNVEVFSQQVKHAEGKKPKYQKLCLLLWLQVWTRIAHCCDDDSACLSIGKSELVPETLS